MQSKIQASAASINRIKDLEQLIIKKDEEILILKKNALTLQQKWENIDHETSTNNFREETQKESSSPKSTFSSANGPPLLEEVSELSPNQLERYSRQLLLSDGFGVAGQKKLLSSSVLGKWCYLTWESLVIVSFKIWVMIQDLASINDECPLNPEYIFPRLPSFLFRVSSTGDEIESCWSRWYWIDGPLIPCLVWLRSYYGKFWF